MCNPIRFLLDTKRMKRDFPSLNWLFFSVFKWGLQDYPYAWWVLLYPHRRNDASNEKSKWFPHASSNALSSVDFHQVERVFSPLEIPLKKKQASEPNSNLVAKFRRWVKENSMRLIGSSVPFFIGGPAALENPLEGRLNGSSERSQELGSVQRTASLRLFADSTPLPSRFFRTIDSL